MGCVTVRKNIKKESFKFIVWEPFRLQINENTSDSLLGLPGKDGFIMQVLIIGGGGREHALAWKAAQSGQVDKVFVAPGNAGTASEGKVENIAIEATNIVALANFAKQTNIRVINTSDFHYPGSAELSDAPDFLNTFPQHCMANSSGAEYVADTIPDHAVEFDGDKT